MDYIDGFVNTEGCQWMFNAYEVSTNNRPELFSHYLFLPDYTDSKTSKDVLRYELGILKTIRGVDGQTTTDDALITPLRFITKPNITPPHMRVSARGQARYPARYIASCWPTR